MTTKKGMDTRKCVTGLTDKQRDTRETEPCMPICFTGDTKTTTM